MNTEPLQRTPLFDEHIKAGAKMVPFAGWEMPVQYSGVIAEHVAVRERVGLFDVSHMGEVICEGPEAEAALQFLTCNDVSKLVDGKAQYSAIINEKGGVVDDIIVYRFNRERYLICVNASNADKDFAWFTSKNQHRATFTNHSAEYGQIAVQGPRGIDLFKSLFKLSDGAVPQPFHFSVVRFNGAEVIAARTGYTGEDGVELFVPKAKTAELWRSLLETGAPHGVVCAGLGARDSLRLEACLPLHGHELSDDITAIESGLGWIVKPEKGDFIGRAILERQKREGAPRRLVGFVIDEPGIARGGDKVLGENGKELGIVTSGTKTPTCNIALGLALVSAEVAKQDAAITIEVRGRKLRARTVKTPFYKRTA